MTMTNLNETEIRETMKTAARAGDRQTQSECDKELKRRQDEKKLTAYNTTVEEKGEWQWERRDSNVRPEVGETLYGKKVTEVGTYEDGGWYVRLLAEEGK